MVIGDILLSGWKIGVIHCDSSRVAGIVRLVERTEDLGCSLATWYGGQ